MENINAKANFIDKQSKYTYFTCQSFSSVIFGGHSYFSTLLPAVVLVFVKITVTYLTLTSSFVPNFF